MISSLCNFSLFCSITESAKTCVINAGDKLAALSVYKCDFNIERQRTVDYKNNKKVN